MVSIFSDLSQEGWEYGKQQRRRRHYHPPPQARHPLVVKPHSHALNQHRRRGGKSRWTWRWCWRGAPRRLRDPLDLLTTSESSSDIDLPPPTMSSGFENSAMKTSFSLSSLQPSSTTLDGTQRVADRPYSSLRKKPRREECHEYWRRSWGCREENKDEFWAALENNYHYLMDSNLIDTCKEAGRDLSGGGSPTHEWSFEQFAEQFTELSTWLDSIQEAVNNRNLSRAEEMQHKSYKRKLFNNQSGRIVARSPELKEEVAWRVSYLNSKWERLEQLISMRNISPDNHELPTDIEHELRCLRKWIKETEKRLQPLDFKTKWTLDELEAKAKEHEAVQKDVWLHGKAVSGVVKLCEGLRCESGPQSLSSWVRGRRLEPTQAASYARGLERRWQLLYIQALEWQCHIDTLTNSAKQQREGSRCGVQESDEEPLTKQPRLTQDEGDVLMDTCDSVDAVDEMEVEMYDGVTEVVLAKDVAHVHQEATRRAKAGGEAPRPCNVRSLLEQTISPQVIKSLFPDETSKFNSSNRSAPNFGTFYFKHSDTEPEVSQSKSGLDESSEEEWTYSVTQEESMKERVKQEEEAAGGTSLGGLEDLPTDEKAEQADKPRLDKIALKLAKEAEEMILEEVYSSPARKRASRGFDRRRFTDPPHPSTKHNLVEEWLLRHPDSKVVGDSCDASGECTTEEDDSEYSEGGLDVTLVAGVCEQAGVSPLALLPPEQRVVLRPRRASTAPRPWSVSGPLVIIDRVTHSIPLPHSTSESAIHQLSQSHSSGKMNSSSNNISTLSSSTVEDTTQTQDGSGGGYSSNSLRRRKIKHRKRSLMRKSDSGGSESLIGQSDGTLASPLKLPVFAKLPMRRASADKALLDSPLRRYHTVPSPSSSGTESESESDNSVRQQKVVSVQPAFRLGPAHTLCSYATDRKDKIVSADSSVSEQAWDNYQQEKYNSEAYSEEAPDSEAARKILALDDDYRNFLDSQSDCASSLGPTPLLHRRRRVTHHGGESDSELEDVWHLVRQSTSQLLFSEKVFSSQLCKASPHIVLASDFAELVTTCKDNIRCLTQMLEKIEEGTSLLSAEECKDIRELISKWERLEKGAEELQKERSLKREMVALRDELLEIATRSTVIEADLEDRDQLELRIQEVKGELSRLRDLNKTQLFQVNLAVHRFLTDTPASPAALKDQVADLYRLWDDTYQRSYDRLRSLEEAGAAWQQFESHLAGLQLALRGDQEALRQFHKALQEGQSVSADLASSLRDIAKLLSERQDSTSTNTLFSLQEMTVDGLTGGRRDEVGSTEGSLSDSGISDSGSEQDLNEREKRLSGLRRLVRHLEAVLAPNSQAILNMSKRLEMTERELRGLQQTCRNLLVKSAVCIESKGKLPILTQPTSNQTSASPKRGEREESKERPRWLLRVLKAALPFHMALVALFWIACLLQPHCCDNFNNLNLSFTPQLRYLKGPPPI